MGRVPREARERGERKVHFFSLQVDDILGFGAV
jgi:hypothetical protein